MLDRLWGSATVLGAASQEESPMAKPSRPLLVRSIWIAGPGSSLPAAAVFLMLAALRLLSSGAAAAQSIYRDLWITNGHVYDVALRGPYLHQCRRPASEHPRCDRRLVRNAHLLEPGRDRLWRSLDSRGERFHGVRGRIVHQRRRAAPQPDRCGRRRHGGRHAVEPE